MDIFTEEDRQHLPNFQNVSQLLEYIENAFRHDVALFDANGEITYSEMVTQVRKTCGALRDLGFVKGNHIGVFFPNSIEAAITLLAVMAFGAVAVIMPAQLDENMIFGASYKYNLNGVILDDSFTDRLGLTKMRLPDLILTPYSEISRLLSPFDFDINQNGDDGACIIFSSGTTGSPKGALLSHLNLMTGTYFGSMGVANFTRQVYYTVLPLSHVFGLIRGFLTPLYSGSRVSFARNMNLIFKEMPLVKPTILVFVPALCELLLNVIKRFGFAVTGGNLKTIIAGAATVPPYFIPEYANFGVKLFPGYGLTESSNLVSGNPDIENRPSSVGILYPGIDVKVSQGELWIKGPNVFKGYYNDPDANESSFEDGYFKTGDLVEFDEAGYLYITGRSKDVIVLSNGENVSPNYLEKHFLKEDMIQDCLVYEDENSKLVLEVFPRDSVYGSLEISSRETFLNKRLQKYNHELLPSMQVTKIIVRSEDFKRTPSMKIIRPKKEANK